MQRRFFTWMAILAFGVQAPLALASADRLMELECPGSGDVAMMGMHKSCCPDQKAPMKCSADECLVGITIVTAHPTVAPVMGPMQSTLIQHRPSKNFVSRGDSPLIRPPIL